MSVVGKLCLFTLLAIQASAAQTTSPTFSPAPREPATQQQPANVQKPTIEQQLAPQLLAVRRIFVDSFGDDPVSRQIRDMVLSGLVESKRFIITENRDRADAVLRGSAVEKTSQELRASSEYTAAGRAAIQDSSAKTETINDARLSVRLVSRDGDVIWSTTQESKGAKYKGASADVAEKIVKQLVRDLDRAANAQKAAEAR